MPCISTKCAASCHICCLIAFSEIHSWCFGDAVTGCMVCGATAQAPRFSGSGTACCEVGNAPTGLTFGLMLSRIILVACANPVVRVAAEHTLARNSPSPGNWTFMRPVDRVALCALACPARFWWRTSTGACCSIWFLGQFFATYPALWQTKHMGGAPDANADGAEDDDNMNRST